MRIIRKPAAKVYRLSISLRRKLLEVIDARSSAPKALVLVYHRVNTLKHDPLEIAISPENFTEQLSWLKENFEVISLPELVDRLDKKKIVGNEAVVTFDDGYKDNLTNALPIAKGLNIPMTIFVSTAILDNPTPFPWDTQYSNAQGTYLSNKDIQALSQEPLVTIGAHTVNHPRLRDLSFKDQRHELQDSKRTLETIIGRPVEYFAYPFGDYPDINASAVRAVKEAGYIAAMTNVQRMATNESDIVMIPRILARDWSKTEIEKRLNRFLKKQ